MMWSDFMDRSDDAVYAYEKAVEMAWECLYEQALEGIGWEVVSDEQDRDGAFVFEFRDLGGYEFRTICDPWPDPNWEPY